MKRLSKLLFFTLVLIIAVAGVFPAAAATPKTEVLIESIISHNLKKTSSASVQDWIDVYLSDNADGGAEWYIMALSNYGNYDFTSYKRTLEKYLSENEVGSASSRLKYALTLIASGERTSPYITAFLENSVGEQGIMSLVFGLHILNNNYKCEKYSVQSLTEELLGLQSDDGGWSLTGRSGDIDVTAMTVQALAPQYESNASVRSAVDKALGFLSASQNADGTYSSYGVNNPESVSQVIIALASLGIDAEKDSRFVKNSNNLFDAIELFRAEDGGYGHQDGTKSDTTATVQVFCAAVAFTKMKNGENPFYIFERNDNVSAEKTKNETSTVVTEAAIDKTANTQTTRTSDNPQTYLRTEESKATSETRETKATAVQDAGNQPEVVSYKLWTAIAVVVSVLMICAVLLMTKKIKIKDCIVIILVAVGVILLVLFVNVKPGQSDVTGTVTISIRCDTVKDEKEKHIPVSGVILKETEFGISADDTVYDILLQACRKSGIHLETTGTADTLYVEGISNIYEKDYGDLSGWMYFVNGESPSLGCGKYRLSDGDEIVWHYTCDLGNDLNY
ncbi:MAG: DUF4430 domain-containing protein [Clostridia bacterium]|nr:DUF4430 domain-containing protein [Clostridia bacterium]